MKDDIFFMTLAVLSLWHEECPEEYFGCVLATDAEEYEFKIVKKNEDLKLMAEEIFESYDKFFGTIYLTVPPFVDLVDLSAEKGVKKIVYMTNKVHVKRRNGVILEPFVNTFGKIIDILSSYKPKDININRV